MSPRFVAVGGLESTPLDDGAVIFHPESGKFLLLNRSAAYLWAQLSTPATEEQLAARLREEFPDLLPEAARADTDDAVALMQELGVVRSANENGTIDSGAAEKAEDSK